DRQRRAGVDGGARTDLTRPRSASSRPATTAIPLAPRRQAAFQIRTPDTSKRGKWSKLMHKSARWQLGSHLTFFTISSRYIHLMINDLLQKFVCRSSHQPG